jgi:hypothetical protein
MNDENREMTEEELQAAFEEQMRNIRVEDVVLQTVATLVNLAGRRLGLAGEGEKDVAQAQVAIDAARALVPFCPEEQLPPIKQAMSQLQIAFAREAEGGGQRAEAQEEAAPKDDEAAAREAARAKLWTPPGT